LVSRRRAALRLAAALGAALGGAGAAAQECAAALALALDVSSSVDAAENALQQQGLAEAFRDPAVIETILYPPGSGVMAAVYAWSGFQHQEILVEWSWLGDEASVRAFADRIEGARRLYDHWPTALGRAADYGARLHDQNPVPCQRRILDISGDGVNNDGVGPDWYRARGRFEDLTINGLVIRGADPDPVAYYRENVITGPGAFVEIADGYEAYPEAILRKLLRELQPPFAMLAE
jgi:Ca-activated chloride channel family protein